MLNRLINNKVSSKNLGIFRILYCLVLLVEVVRLSWFKELIYDKVPFFEPSEVSFNYIFKIWMIVLVAMIFGYKTRFFAILNYLLGLFLIGTIKTYEYHMFYTYMGVNFLLIFIPVSRSFSLDNLLERINNSSIRKIHVPEEKVSEFHYYLLIFFGIALVYLDSVFFKLCSPMWNAGLGMWQSGSLPFAVQVNASWLLNQEFIMKFLGYLTVVFELVFIFLFWHRWFKIPFFIIGLGLHIGIYILFPIPQFAQGVIAIYMLLLPFTFFERRKISESKKPLLFFYDNECPLCLRTRIVISFFDVFRQIQFLPVQSNYDKYPELRSYKYEELLDNIYSLNNGKVYCGVDTYIAVLKKMKYTCLIGLFLQVPGIYHLSKKVYGMVAANRNTERCNEENCEVGFGSDAHNSGKVKLFRNFSVEDAGRIGWKFLFYSLLLLQLSASLRAPLLLKLFGGVSAYRYVVNKTESLKSTSKALFGLTNHGLFMDHHFAGYNHIIRVDYVNNGRNIVLPIIEESGMVGDYLKNFTWAKWTFRVDGPNIKMPVLEKGIRDFTAYWLHKSEVRYQDGKEFKFKVYCKKIESPNGYEYDFLNRQIAKEWQEVGEVIWKDKVFTSHIRSIEDI